MVCVGEDVAETGRVHHVPSAKIHYLAQSPLCQQQLELQACLTRSCCMLLRVVPTPHHCRCPLAVYLFLRWLYARIGITSRPIGSSNQQYQPVPQHVKQGVLAFVHADCDDVGTESSHGGGAQLELTDCPSGHSGGGETREIKLKGLHQM